MNIPFNPACDKPIVRSVILQQPTGTGARFAFRNYRDEKSECERLKFAKRIAAVIAD